jgi:hypothetical protein
LASKKQALLEEKETKQVKKEPSKTTHKSAAKKLKKQSK